MRKLLFFFLIFSSFVFAEPKVIALKGFLGHEELQGAYEKIERIKKAEEATVIVQLSSSSGEFKAAFDFAQALHELRENHHKHVIVYIQGRAIGPAAILPFAANELYVTPLAAWGDIPYGTSESLDWSREQSMVKALIDSKNEQARVFKELADAMIDPHYQLVYQNEKPLIEREETSLYEPLILSTERMESLNVVSTVLSDEAFQKKYDPYHDTLSLSQLYKGTTLDQRSLDVLNKALAKHIPFSQTEENLVGYLRLTADESIRQSTYLDFRFALEDFKKKEVRFVLLHLDTPGGEVLSSLKIVDLLQKMDVNEGIPIIAYIDNWAVSAGALLSYGCRFIFVNSQSVMGAAEPVVSKESGQMETASEKVNSALRAEFANTASFYERDPLIAEAMVDKDIILVMRDHKLIKLRSEEEIQTEGAHPDLVITEKGKLLTLNAKQLVDLGIADYQVQSATPLQDPWQEHKTSWPAHQNPVFEQPYLKEMPHGVMIAYRDWRVTFFSILSHPFVLSLLFMGLVIGFYVEINTPGFGIPGSIGLACLALILLSSFAMHAIHWIECIMLIGGLVLLAIELFVIPGFGIVGILGIFLTIIGLFALMLPGIEKLSLFHLDSLELVGKAFMMRLIYFSSALVLSILIIVLLARFFAHRFFRFSKLVLHDTQEGDLSYLPEEQIPKEGEVGETLTPLKPGGKVQIGEQVYEAASQAGYLERGKVVEVMAIEGNRLIVRPLDTKGE